MTLTTTSNGNQNLEQKRGCGLRRTSMIEHTKVRIILIMMGERVGCQGYPFHSIQRYFSFTKLIRVYIHVTSVFSIKHLLTLHIHTFQSLFIKDTRC